MSYRMMSARITPFLLTLFLESLEMINYFRNSTFAYFGKFSSFFHFFYQIYTIFLLIIDWGMIYRFELPDFHRDSSPLWSEKSKEGKLSHPRG